MLRLLFIICFFILSTALTLAEPVTTPLFDPLLVYDGPFEPKKIYQVGIKPLNESVIFSMEQLEEIQCPEARVALNLHGRWEGHLKRNGECELPDGYNEYLAGNLLNYIFQTRGGPR